MSNGFRFVLLSPTSVELVSWFCSREWDCRKEKNSVSSRLLKETYLNVLKGKGTTEIRWNLYPFACEKTFPGKAQGKEMVAAMRTLYPFACEKGFYWNCSFARFCLSYMLYIIPIRYFKKETLEAMKVESATNYFVQNSLSQMLRESPKYAYSTVIYSRKTEGIFSSSKFWQNIPLLSQRKEGEYFPKKIYFRSRIEKSKGSL